MFPRQLAVVFKEVKTLQWSASDSKYKLMYHSYMKVIRLKFCEVLKFATESTPDLMQFLESTVALNWET